MMWESVFNVVKANIKEFLPDVAENQITPQKSLSDLGANSIDRMDIALKSMEDLNIIVSPEELAGVKNIDGLVTLLATKAAF